VAVFPSELGKTPFAAAGWFNCTAKLAGELFVFAPVCAVPKVATDVSAVVVAVSAVAFGLGFSTNRL
jgi:hypothetical protein